MSSELLTVIIVVGTALAFDFTNGFHDTANVVATSISTGAARPRVAIAFASILNYVGAFISITVAATLIEMKAPRKLSSEANPIATDGRAAPVEIEVATTLAVSWKPLVKSNARAVPMTRMRMISESMTRP